MKDIKDYIGTKTAILCKTQEEWDYIRSLDTGTVIPSYIFADNNINGLSITVEDNTFFWASGNFYDRKGLTTLPATDFMPTAEPQREIEAYRWKKGRNVYTDAVDIICNNTWPCGTGALITDTIKIRKLAESGVLDLWFEPVYKEVKVWPKKGAPCLVWDEGDNRAMYFFSQGNGLFTLYKTNSGGGKYDYYLELTPENLDKLPFNK